MPAMFCRKCGRELSFLQADLCSACESDDAKAEEHRRRQTQALEAVALEAEEQRRRRVASENAQHDADLRRRGVCVTCEGRQKCPACGGRGKVTGEAKKATDKAKGFFAAILWHVTGVEKTLDVAVEEPCRACAGGGGCPACQPPARRAAAASPPAPPLVSNPGVPDYDCHIGYLFGFGLHTGGAAAARKHGGMIRELQFEPDGFREIERMAAKCSAFGGSPFANALRKVASVRQHCGLADPNRFDADDEFKSKLLWGVLAGCTPHRGGVTYPGAHEVLNLVLGMNAGHQVGLGFAYDADPQGLSAWAAEAEKHPPHPTYHPTDLTTPYWRMEFVVTPLHLVTAVVDSDPLHVLKSPGNLRELVTPSNEYAEAFFPHEINRRRKKGTWK